MSNTYILTEAYINSSQNKFDFHIMMENGTMTLSYVGFKEKYINSFLTFQITHNAVY